MKLIITSLAALTVATAVGAAPTPSFELKGYGVDTSGLNSGTIARLNAAVHGGGSESEKAQAVRSIIQQAGR